MERSPRTLEGRDKVLLNCEMDPDFLYPNLKALAILFDQIVLWSPDEAKMEHSGLLPKEIDAAFQPTVDGPPVFLVGARSNYFDFDARGSDVRFRARQRERAEVSRTIVPHESRDEVYEALKTYRSRDEEYWNVVMARLHAHFDSHTRNPNNYDKIHVHARRHGVNVEYALVGEFLLEVKTCVDMERQMGQLRPGAGRSIMPFADVRHSKAYGLLQDAISDYATTSLRQVNHFAKSDRIDLITSADSAIDARFLSETIRHINAIFTARKLTWREVLEVRKEIGAKVRSRYSLRSGTDERNVKHVIASVEFWMKTYALGKYLLVEQVDNLLDAAGSSVAPDMMSTFGLMKQAANEAGVKDHIKAALPIVLAAVGAHGGEIGKAVCRFDLAELQFDDILAKALLRPVFRFASFSTHIALAASELRQPTRLES